MYALFFNFSIHCHSVRNFDRGCRDILGTDRYCGSKNDRDLVVFTIPLCGNSGGHNLFAQFYDSYPRTFTFSMDRIVLLYAGRIS